MTLAEKVQVLCTRYPCSVTSWWRSVRRNAFVGGAPHSLHLVGRAVDVVFDDEPPSVATLEGLGFRVLKEADHFHLEADY